MLILSHENNLFSVAVKQYNHKWHTSSSSHRHVSILLRSQNIEGVVYQKVPKMIYSLIFKILIKYRSSCVNKQNVKILVNKEIRQINHRIVINRIYIVTTIINLEIN